MSRVAAPPVKLPRRHRQTRDAARFFRWLTFAAAPWPTAILGMPIVGYLFGALRKHRVHWVGLGPPGQFPLNETRLATFDNPLRQPWDGMAAIRASTSATWVRTTRSRNSSWSSPSTAPTWAARCPGSRSRACSCVRATAASITRTASAPRDRRRAGLFHCVWRMRDGQLEVQAPHLPTLQDTLEQIGERVEDRR